jgi:hypothetical protein
MFIEKESYMKWFLTLLMLVSTTTFAHDDATLDKMKTPNGGQLRMAGAYHIELVVVKDSPQSKENPLVIYLTDHGDGKISSAGMKASVTLFAGGTKATAELKPDGDNRLKGVARYASAPDMKAVVSLTAADGKTVQARFTPLEKAAEHAD